MRDHPDASGPPYRYPFPLPSDAERAHLDAAEAIQRRINKWNGFAFTPGWIILITAIFWGGGRTSEPGEWIWRTSPDVASGLLWTGLPLTLFGLFPIIALALDKSRHLKLLRAYQVPIDRQGRRAEAPRTPPAPEEREQARHLLGERAPLAPQPDEPDKTISAGTTISSARTEGDEVYDGTITLDRHRRH